MNPPAVAPAGDIELARLLREFALAEAALLAHLDGQVDAIVDQHGQSVLLRAAQQQLLSSEHEQRVQAETQTAILDALPSHVALVDAAGVIIAVNASWRCFAVANGLPGASYGVGRNYLEICDQSRGEEARDAQAVAAGLRAVLSREEGAFSCEYPCHERSRRRWFQMTITPLSGTGQTGAVIAHTDISTRKLAELAMQASEERFRATFEQAAVGIAHVAPDGRFLRVNDRLCALVGYAREELLGLTFAALSFPEDRPQAEAARFAMLSGASATYEAEERYRRSDGEAVWIHLVTGLAHGQGDEPAYFISVIEDITARKNAELRVRRLNRLYAVLSAVGEAIVRIHDLQQLYERVCRIVVDEGLLSLAAIAAPVIGSAAIAPLASWGRAGVLVSGANVATDGNGFAQGTIGTVFTSGGHDVCNDLLHEARMAPWREAIAASGFLASASFPLWQDGAVVAALLLFADEADYFRSDEIALMISVSENISFALEAMHQEGQRRAIEESLRTNERRNRALIEHSADGIALVDAGNRILYLSPAVAAIEGYSPQELLQRSGMEHTHPDDAERVQGIIRELLANPGRPIPVLWRRQHKLGHWLWLEGVATNLLDDPAVRAIVTNYRDVTARQLAEVSIRQSQDSLRMASRLGRIGAWSIDLPAFALTWSEEIRAIHEVPADFTPTLAASFAFYPPEHRAPIERAFEACMSSGAPFDIELQILTAAGRRIWVRAIGEAVRDAAGHVSRVQGALQDISERKHAAEENRQVAERLTTTLESLTDAFFTVDRGWRFTYVNRHAELLLGRTRADLLGKGMWDEFPELAGSALHPGFARAGADGVAVRIEESIPSLHGWFEARAYPSAQGLAIYLRDVSAQHQAHEALLLSEARFRLVTKATNDAIWDFDIVADLIWRNEGIETLFGYAPGEPEPTIAWWSMHVHAADRERVLAGFHAAIANGAGNWSAEYRFRRHDGGYAYVLDRGHIQRDATGKALRMIGGMTDLTARKQAEERIVEQAALLDNARDAITVRDLEHRITFWNKGAERLFGWESAAAVGASARTLLFQEDATFDLATAAVIAHGEWNGELSPLARDGRKLLISSRWTLVRDAAGTPRAVFCISTDITERRKLERQFLRAQRLESIGTLAGGIAHDLNNVLAPIMLSISLLSLDELDPRRLRMLAIIEASAKRGADMVQQVLSFARGVEGKRMPVTVAQLLRDIEQIVNDTFLKHIQARVVLAPGLWTVNGDSTQLHQVLINLCVNARDAMPDGGTLTLSAANLVLDGQGAKLYPESLPGPYVEIRVEDTGTGMPPEVLDKIFEPFFTTKELGKGTGLGLSTSLAVVKSHGGSLRVYSEPGKGTTFRILLPALPATAPGAAVREEVEPPRGHDELVLVVDDELALRLITRQTLEAFGYRVLLAANGKEAIALFAAQPDAIALVLTDMMMPVMDGNATIHSLEAIRPGVRIIAASGLNANGVIAKAASGVVKHFLAKPYTAAALLEKIHEALSGD